MKKVLVALCILMTVMIGGVRGQEDRNQRDRREDRRREQGQDAHDMAASIGSHEFTATPANAATGTQVTLSWEILPKDPAGRVQGSVEIQYEGLNSGVWRDLPKVGTRQVCPLGATVYSLKIRSSRERALSLGTRRVEAPCPSQTITNELLQALVDTLGEEIGEFDPSIRVRDLRATISRDGISLSMRGEKRVRQFPNIDIRTDLLAVPRAEGNLYRADIRKFSVNIGSAATRIAWDLITVGHYEIAKAALEAYFEKEYRKNARQRIEDKLNELLPPLPAGAIPVIRFESGSMIVSVCVSCN